MLGSRIENEDKAEAMAQRGQLRVFTVDQSMKLQIQEVLQTPNRVNIKETKPRHTVSNLLKKKHKIKS